MLVGYARDSGAGQSLEVQLRALSDAGCAKMFSHQKAGTLVGVRDALEGALDFVRGGDTLVVTRLDHLAPSLNDIHGIMARLASSGVDFHCLQQSRVNPETQIRHERQRNWMDKAGAAGVSLRTAALVFGGGNQTTCIPIEL